MPKASASRSVTRTAVLRSGVMRKKKVEKIKTSNGKPAGSAMPRTPQRLPHRRTARSKIARTIANAAQDEEPKIEDQLDSMIEDVMPHLVRHYEADFRQGALLEQVVI